MSTVRRSIVASVADKYASQAASVLTLAVMSRLLTPAETGLYLLANTVILLSENLRVFGVGIYVVQEKTLGRDTLRAVFTVTLLMSLTVALGIAASAGGIASFFDEPDLAYLLRVSAVAFIVAPFGNPIIAVLQRELAFTTLAVINVTGAIANTVVTISLGAMGFGAVSYVWGFVAYSAVMAGLAVMVRPDFGIFRLTLAGARRIVSFGAISSSVTLLNMAYEMLPRLALARLLGVDAVGVYGRAVTICQLPERALTQAVLPVVLPAMAAHARDGGDLKVSYLRGHALMSAIQWPTLIMLALLADPLVLLLLGDQWGETPPLVRMIALSMMATAPAFMTFPLLVSVGRIRDVLYLSLISLPPSALIVIGAATVGLDAVAASMLLIAPMQMFVALLFIRRAIGLSFAEMAAASRRSVLLTLATAAVPVLLILVSPNGLKLGAMETLLAVAGAAIGWLLAVVLTDHPIKTEVVSVWRMVGPASRRILRAGRRPAE